MNKHLHLYLIEFGHCLKVGVSSNAEKRIRKHVADVSNHGLDATILNQWISPKIYNALEIEKSCVLEFSEEGREWLKAGFAEVLAHIKAHKFKDELTKEEIEQERALSEALATLIPPVAQGAESIQREAAALAAIERVSFDIVNSALSLLVLNQEAEDLSSGVEKYNLFMGCISEYHNRIKFINTILKGIIRNIEREDFNYNTILNLILFDELEALGFTPVFL